MSLNWQRFEEEQWLVEERPFETPEVVGQFFSFMRISFGRVNTRKFLHGISRNMRVHEVLAKLDKAPPHHRASILAFRDQFRSVDGPIKLDIPLYRVRNRGHFILDGNHRLCGLVASGSPFTLRTFAVHGPQEADALRDLPFCR